MNQRQGANKPREMVSPLESFGIKMNDFTEGYDGLVGRDKEVDQLIATLYQRKKPNPVLIGEAGVGKTQIVEGLVQKIQNGEVVGKLEDAYIYQIDVKRFSIALQQFGTEVVNALIAEVAQNHEQGHPTILFMDELHTLVGAVSPSNVNAENPADVLKPALARGDIRVIGATTVTEYRRIEADKALERRFSPIFVDELTESETMLVLEGARAKYEEFHGVTYGDKVFDLSIDLASRYMPDRAFPDKALDVIDKIGAKISSTTDQEGLTFEQERLEYEGLVALLNMSKSLVNNRDSDINRWGHEFESIIESRQELESQRESDRKLVTKLDVRNYIKDSQGLETLIEEYTEEEIVTEMKSRIVGQDIAVGSVASHMILSNFGFKHKTKPKMSMLFYGETGVGKTEMAKQISRIMFGSEKLLSIDGGEFQESHTISKLVGSPAGYVGYGTPTPFDSLRRKPNQVILIDEFDKMHPNVKQLFLGVLEEGRMKDGTGNALQFNESVIIFTTNEKPARSSGGEPKVGFSMASSEPTLAIDNELFEDRPKFKEMRPELVNRFDEVIEFSDMTEEVVSRIFDIKFGDFKKTAEEEHGWVVNMSDTAKNYLIKASYNPTYGARPVNRNVSKLESMVVKEYSNYMAQNNGRQKREFNIVLRDDKIAVV